MTRTEMLNRIRVLRAELENRHNLGIVKMADAKGTPVPVEDLQNELFSLIYKSSKKEQ